MKRVLSLFKKSTPVAGAALAASVGVAATSAVAADIAPFSATYALSADGKSGTATRTLKKSGNSYSYTVSARAAGIITGNQSASFSLQGNQVVPTSATTSYKVAGVGRTHNIKFSGKQAVSTYKGKSTTIAMPRQAYDDLSLEVQIRQELINGKFTGKYPLVKRTSIETTAFRRVNNEKITVPAGTYDTVRIDRVHNDKGRSTSFWLAPSLNYLPVKVSQASDGKVITMNLTKLN